MIELSNDRKYITYFRKGDKFDVNKMHTDLTTVCSKPRHAFWGSPVDTEFGWKEWCENEYYEQSDFSNFIHWRCKPNTQIYKIDWDDVLNLNSDNQLIKYVDFIKFADDINTDIVINDVLNTSEKIKILNYRSSAAFSGNIKLNFGRMLQDGIKAVELMDACIGHAFNNRLETEFNSWDCESIVLLDKDVLDVID